MRTTVLIGQMTSFIIRTNNLWSCDSPHLSGIEIHTVIENEKFGSAANCLIYQSAEEIHSHLLVSTWFQTFHFFT